jgi:hypothetical protein
MNKVLLFLWIHVSVYCELGTKYFNIVAKFRPSKCLNVIQAVTLPSSQGTLFFSGSTGVMCVVENGTVRRILLRVMAI